MNLSVDWTKSELIPACVQDYQSRQILMLGYMNQESLKLTIAGGEVVFFSRSKGRLWKKGETSGNRLKVISIKQDCDRDAIVIEAEPKGPTCHTLRPSCFDATELEVLERTIKLRKNSLESQSYTAKLLQGPKKEILKKIGEEATEVVVAMALEDDDKVAEEIADLMYHLTVGLELRSIKWENVFSVLAKRRLMKSTVESLK